MSWYSHNGPLELGYAKGHISYKIHFIDRVLNYKKKTKLINKNENPTNLA